MIHKKPMKTVALVLSLVLLLSGFAPAMYVQADTAGTDDTAAGESGAVITYSDERISNNYTIVSGGYTLPEYQGEVLEYQIKDAYTGGTAALTTDTYDYAKGNQAVRVEIGQQATMTINVPTSAVYYISMDYISCADSILAAEASLQVNGAYPFYELRSLSFENVWVDAAEPSYDRYGNQIVSIPDKAMEWRNKYLLPTSYRHSMPMGVELDAGENTLTIEVAEGALLIGNIYLCPAPVVAEYTGSEAAAGDGFVDIQAETPTYRNDSSIRPVCEYDVDLYPYSVKEKELNTIDNASFKDAGQTLTYEFTAPKSGYYYVAMNYKQGDKTDFPVFMNVTVDGQIPNTEFKDYQFDYIKEYKLLTLKDANGEKLSVYLEEGTHTIALTISVDPIRSYLETVDRIMSEVNDLSLEITKVVGTNKDKYRDFDLESYIPGIGDKLIGWANEMDAMMEGAESFVPGVKEVGAFSSLTIAANQLRSLAKDVDELLYRIAELSTSSNSVNQYLANLLDSLNGNKFSLDAIYLYQEDSKNQLPEKVGFWKGVMSSIQRFAYSFQSQAYSTTNADPDHLQVWVNRSRQHLEIMQKMIDESFTPATGIEVDLSLMPDQNKLVLANASGDAPDIATGINYAVPFDLAIRGALKDLTEFEDFNEIALRYNEALFVPSTIGDSIYSMPETMNFWVLFYRSDILSKLGLSVPQTMDDVRGMLTDLQMRGLNFYHPTAGMAAMRNFHGTTPILFQHGASLYSTYAGDTAINSEEAVSAFTELTELFTIYNMPVDVPNFYQHFRNGDLPIGIADFGTYNLILKAAQEMASAWESAWGLGVE